MSLVDSLLAAIVRLDGDSLVLHTGEKPYVVTSSAAMNAFRGPLAWGQVELSTRVLAPDAVMSMLAQLLTPAQLGVLDELGAVENELPATEERPPFTIIAARGGEDIWVEIRPVRPKKIVEPPAPTAPPAPAAVVARPSAVAPPATSLSAPPPPDAPPRPGEPPAPIAHVAAPAAFEIVPEVEQEDLDEAEVSELLASSGLIAGGAAPVVIHAEEGEEEEEAVPVNRGVGAQESEEEPEYEEISLEAAVPRAEPPPAITPVTPVPVEMADLLAAREQVAQVAEERRQHEARLELLRRESERLEAEQLEQSARIAAEREEAERATLQRLDAERAALAAAREEEIARLAAEREEEIARLAAERGEEIARLAAEREQEMARLSALREERERAIAALQDEEAKQLAALREEEAQKLAALRDEEMARLAAARAEEAQRLAALHDAETARLAVLREEMSRLAAARAAEESAVRLHAERIEAARAELANIVAERVEQERRTEAARADQVRAETARAEFVRLEAARLEEERRLEAARTAVTTEQIRAEQARLELARIQESRAQEESRLVVLREEAARLAVQREELTRLAVDRDVELARWTALREEESLRITALRQEAAHAAAQRDELNRVVAQRQAELARLRTVQNDEAKLDVARRLEEVVEAPERIQPHAGPIVAREAPPSPALARRESVEIPEARPAQVVPLVRTVRDVSHAAASGGVPDIDRLLRIAAARGASGLYLVTDSVPTLRVDGEIQELGDEEPLGAGDVEAFMLALAPEPSRDAVKRGETYEWFCTVPEVGGVRCLAFHDHRGPGVIVRLMPGRMISADQLGLSRDVQSVATYPDGLVLVTGPRASGKSTVMAALVDLVNRTRADHVITIERQLTFVHERRKAFVSQREVRGEAHEVLASVRAALREDPDVLVIEELRSPEVVFTVLEAAESGRLILAGYRAPAARQALERLIDLIPADVRGQVLAGLSSSLRAVLAQALLRKRGGGRVAARELLLNTPAVASVIAEGKLFQLTAALESGRKFGSVPLNDALLALIRDGSVDPSEAWRNTYDRDGLLTLLKREGVDTSFVERLA